MVALTPPFSTAAVDVPQGLVGRYVEAGWKRLDEAEETQVAPEEEVADGAQSEDAESVEEPRPVEAETPVVLQKRGPGRPKKSEDDK